MTRELRGALIGCGFFARNHLHGWQEVDGARYIAVCDRDKDRAEAVSREFGIPACYVDAEEMLRTEAPDFVDIVTQPASHRPLVELAARHGAHVICQKPIAPTMEDAKAIVDACSAAQVQLMIHENFRWQTPMRETKAASEQIGEIFFGQISFRSAWDVYTAQPYLARDDRFIIYDLGVHLLDLARYFLGEVEQLTCQTQRVNPDIRAEDVATILLKMRSRASAIVDLSYFSKLENETFPQTLVHLEGTEGSVTLDRDYTLTVVRNGGITRRSVEPVRYSWSEPPAINVQESVVTIQQHWVDSLRNARTPETSGADNLRTIELVFGSYESARTGMPYRTVSTR